MTPLCEPVNCVSFFFAQFQTLIPPNTNMPDKIIILLINHLVTLKT